MQLWSVWLSCGMADSLSASPADWCPYAVDSSRRKGGDCYSMRCLNILMSGGCSYESSLQDARLGKWINKSCCHVNILASCEIWDWCYFFYDSIFTNCCHPHQNGHVRCLLKQQWYCSGAWTAINIWCGRERKVSDILVHLQPATWPLEDETMSLPC